MAKIRYITYQFDSGSEIESGLRVQNAFDALAEGSHSVTVRGYDLNGNVAFTSIRNFTKTASGLPLIAEYPMTETSGDMIDVINGYNGTVFGSMGRDGNSYTFNGSNAYVEISDEDDFSFVDVNGDVPFEIEFFIVFNNTSGNQYIIAKRDNTTSRNEWQIHIVDSVLRLRLFENGEGSNTMTRGFDIIGLQNNEEYHVKFTYDGSETRAGIGIFIDGQETLSYVDADSSTYNGMANTDSVVTVGRAEFNQSLYFEGKIRNLTIKKVSNA